MREDMDEDLLRRNAESELWYDEFTCGDCAHYIGGYACTLSHPWASAHRAACEDFNERT